MSNMEEREGWQAMMTVWESWKDSGGYSTHDAIIIETLCGEVDENPIVVDSRPLSTCSVIQDAFQEAVDKRATFRTAKGAISYVTRVLDNARSDGRIPSERPGTNAYKRKPQTREDERRKLGRDDKASARTPPIF